MDLSFVKMTIPYATSHFVRCLAGHSMLLPPPSADRSLTASHTCSEHGFPAIPTLATPKTNIADHLSLKINILSIKIKEWLTVWFVRGG